MLRKKGGEVIGFAVADGGIQRACALAGGEHVPQRAAAREQRSTTFRIGQLGGKTHDFGNDGPKEVARVGVVLSGLQRGFAGHGAEDEGVRAFVRDWGKGVQQGRGSRHGNKNRRAENLPMMPLCADNFPCCERKKGFQRRCWKPFVFGRGGGIRTRDPLHPMQVRYQAALRPEQKRYSSTKKKENHGG